MADASKEAVERVYWLIHESKAGAAVRSEACAMLRTLEIDLAAAGAKIERLREALERIEAASKFWSEYPDGNDAIRYAHESTRRLARAALSSVGEKG